MSSKNLYEMLPTQPGNLHGDKMAVAKRQL